MFVIVRFSDSLVLAKASGLGNLTMFVMELLRDGTVWRWHCVKGWHCMEMAGWEMRKKI